MHLKTSSIERKIKRIIPSSFKKFILFFLVNRILGRLIKIARINRNLFGGVFDYSNVSDKEAARIFWGVWESAEIRFSKRFANSKTIIELGSSVGVTLGVLANTRSDTKFVCIEASPINFEKLKRLKRKLPNNGNDYVLLNAAIAYGVSNVEFEHSTTTGSKISDNTSLSSKLFTVPALSLSELLSNQKIDGPFTLITDIEGAEASIFFEDSQALDNCDRIIAELDNSPMYSADEQLIKLNRLGFKISERYGNVVFMAQEVKKNIK